MVWNYTDRATLTMKKLSIEELKSFRKFESQNKILNLSEMLTYTSRNFHLAYQVASLESEDVIAKIINSNNIESDEVKTLLKISIVCYLKHLPNFQSKII